MLKRIAAYLLIVMANMAFLAHVVIPHHHHNRVVCFEHSHCAPDSHNHHSDSEHNEHQHEKSSSNCVLKQLVLLPVNQTKHDAVDISHAPHFPNFVATPLSNTSLSKFFLNPVSTQLNSGNSALFALYFSNAKGLRAPPTV